KSVCDEIYENERRTVLGIYDEQNLLLMERTHWSLLDGLPKNHLWTFVRRRRWYRCDFTPPATSFRPSSLLFPATVEISASTGNRTTLGRQPEAGREEEAVSLPLDDLTKGRLRSLRISQIASQFFSRRKKLPERKEASPDAMEGFLLGGREEEAPFSSPCRIDAFTASSFGVGGNPHDREMHTLVGTLSSIECLSSSLSLSTSSSSAETFLPGTWVASPLRSSLSEKFPSDILPSKNSLPSKGEWDTLMPYATPPPPLPSLTTFCAEKEGGSQHEDPPSFLLPPTVCTGGEQRGGALLPKIQSSGETTTIPTPPSILIQKSTVSTNLLKNENRGYGWVDLLCFLHNFFRFSRRLSKQTYLLPLREFNTAWKDRRCFMIGDLDSAITRKVLEGEESKEDGKETLQKSLLRRDSGISHRLFRLFKETRASAVKVTSFVWEWNTWLERFINLFSWKDFDITMLVFSLLFILFFISIFIHPKWFLLAKWMTLFRRGYHRNLWRSLAWNCTHRHIEEILQMFSLSFPSSLWMAKDVERMRLAIKQRCGVLLSSKVLHTYIGLDEALDEEDVTMAVLLSCKDLRQFPQFQKTSWLLNLINHSTIDAKNDQIEAFEKEEFIEEEDMRMEL
ncbi:hypothetical protein IE077_002907, partial [Cardiosporidium cionae]